MNNGKASQEYNSALKEELCVLELSVAELMVDEISERIDHFNYRSRGVEAKDSLA